MVYVFLMESLRVPDGCLMEPGGPGRDPYEQPEESLGNSPGDGLLFYPYENFTGRTYGTHRERPILSAWFPAVHYGRLLMKPCACRVERLEYRRNPQGIGGLSQIGRQT